MNKLYRVLPEYRDNWTNDGNWNGVVTIDEIIELARGWDKAVDELMDQVEEEDIWTVAMAAKAWDLSPYQVRALIKDGRVPGVTKALDANGRAAWQIPAQERPAKMAPGRKPSIAADIEAAYAESKSISGAARACGVSDYKATKMLISAGVLLTPRAANIRELRAKGWTMGQIAEHLGISTNAVLRHMPYSKALYNSDTPSPTAARIRKMRAKRKGAE